MTFSLANKMNVTNECQKYLYSQTNHEILCKKEKSLTRRERKEQNYKLHRAINSLKARSFKVTATAICKDSNLLQWKNLRTRFRIGSFVIFDASVTTYFALSWVYLGSCFVLTFAVLLQLLWSTTQFVFLSLGWTKHRIHQKGDFFLRKINVWLKVQEVAKGLQPIVDIKKHVTSQIPQKRVWFVWWLLQY